jgi:outer membrane receptor protein involved in Fe transport
MGANRTLVLVDRRRHVPVSPAGGVNINVVPQALIQRVEVVSGGVSAKWGSDAVAGVVNMVTDRAFEGVRVETRYGQSSEGDGEDLFGSFAYGMKSGDGRGHISFGAEYQNNDGITKQAYRDWGLERWGIVTNVADTGPGDGIPARIITRDVVLGLGADGGYLPEWAGNHPAVTNIRFGSNGELLPYDIGQIPAPDAFEVLPFQVGGDGVSFGDDTGLFAPYERKNVMIVGDRELTDGLNVFFDVSYGESESVNPILQPLNTIFLGGPTTLRADNPFIPPDLQQLMTANAIPEVYIARSNDDFGFQTSDSTTKTTRFVLGLQGQAGSLNWETYVMRGDSDFISLNLNRVIVDNYLFAADAVRDPGSGEIVCRANLNGANGAPGCQPLNLFGEGAPSQSALDYIHATQVNRWNVDQTVIAAVANAKVFDLPAGPLSIAFGGEYREDSAETHPDKFFDGGGDFSGEIDVTEVFLEAGVPLFSGSNGFSLNLNGAVRYTDYSTSGDVTTWNAGLTFSPFTDLSIRGSRSRDIRAPNVNELFSVQSEFFGNVQDPFINGTSVVRFRVGGNPELVPEEADTTSFGIVYQPSWLSGFGVSVDWYSIELEDAISSLFPQIIIDNCFNLGVGCDALGFDPVTGAIFSVDATNTNVAKRTVEGIDAEAAYARGGIGGGKMDVRLLASYVSEQSASPDGITVFDDAGVVSTSAQGGNPTPEWRWNLTVDYSRNNFGAFAQVRYVDGGIYRADYTIEDINDNTVDHAYYVNFGVRYNIEIGDESNLQVFAGLNNAFDEVPPICPEDFLHNLRTNESFYDVIGRYWFTGLRATF